MLTLPRPAPKNRDSEVVRPPGSIAGIPACTLTDAGHADGAASRNSGVIPSLIAPPDRSLRIDTSAGGFRPEQRAAAAKVSTYLSSLQTLTGNFVQVGPDAPHHRRRLRAICATRDMSQPTGPQRRSTKPRSKPTAAPPTNNAPSPRRWPICAFAVSLTVRHRQRRDTPDRQLASTYDRCRRWPEAARLLTRHPEMGCLGCLEWWAMTGSNRRHLRCKRSALPTELIARKSGRTFEHFGL